MSHSSPQLKALHIASGDLWAGAEVQLFTLLTQLAKGGEVQAHAALLNDGDLARKLREQGIAVTVFDETLLDEAQIVRGLRSLMNALKPDIVHTHRQKENVLGSIANMLATRSRCVRTCHGAPESKRGGLRNLHKRLIGTLDLLCGRFLQQKIIAVSAALGRDLSRHFKPQRIAVIDNGIDIEALRSQVRPVDFRSSEPAAAHIGVVGRLEPVKRVDIFLQMAALVLRQAPQRQWRFHVIGAGSLDAKLRQLAKDLHIHAAVTFHGHRSDSVACLAALDALVVCSDHEGMPMTPMESIAVGTPVVAHDVGGLTNLLAGQAGGLLTGDHTAQGYADALLRLLSGDIAALLDKGAVRIESEFSAARNAHRITALYRSLSPHPAREKSE